MMSKVGGEGGKEGRQEERSVGLTYISFIYSFLF
jgi:hypothetical protein